MPARWPLAVFVCAILALASATHGAPSPSPRAQTFKRGTVTIAQDGRRVVVDVEVADTFELRARGLMYRTELAENAGMWFVFEDAQRLSFWMKNTLLPLSIAFVDAAGVIGDIQDMNPPQPGGDIPIILSRSEAKYALEVNQGFFRRHNLTVGARVTFRWAR
jgi:uncharacterized membrane protein (UPF0127 family)